VGITRAEDTLALIWARQRRRAGDFTYGSLSSFVDAVPEDHLQPRKSRRLRSMEGSTPHRSRGSASADRHRRGAVGDFSGGQERLGGRSRVNEPEVDEDVALNQDLP